MWLYKAPLGLSKCIIFSFFYKPINEESWLMNLIKLIETLI